MRSISITAPPARRVKNAKSAPTSEHFRGQLGDGKATVLELTELIGTTQQNVSKHLGVLQ